MGMDNWILRWLTLHSKVYQHCQGKRKGVQKFKFGVEIPRSPKHALQLDEEHGNNNWQKSIKKELDEINDYETFRLPEDGESLIGFQQIPNHLVFDVKFDGRHKSRLVAGGNHTEPPKEDIYSGVMSIESIRILFFLATLNHHQI